MFYFIQLAMEFFRCFENTWTWYQSRYMLISKLALVFSVECKRIIVEDNSIAVISRRAEKQVDPRQQTTGRRSKLLRLATLMISPGDHRTVARIARLPVSLHA